MSRRPYIEHYQCHVAHVTDWPRYSKVWVAWGIMGWRPGIVVGHRENRVGVRVIDGKWPFTAGHHWAWRRLGLTFVAPNTLRARRGEERPQESATSRPACLDLAARGTYER